MVQQDYDRALEEFEIARKNLANHSDLYSMTAMVQMRQGEWYESLANYQKAAQLDPRSASKNLDVAIGYAYLGMYSEAEFFIDRSISLAPDMGHPNWHKLSICLLTGNKEKARDVIKKLPYPVEPADVLWTDRFFGVYSLGLWRFGLTDQSPAQLAQRVSETYTGSKKHAYYFSMAQLYDLMNQSDTSRAYYDSARVFIQWEMQEDEDNFHLHTDLGMAYAFLGMGDEAINEGERAMELMPTSSCHW
jgi:tetratricopeptide (TPR) repeat protein